MSRIAVKLTIEFTIEFNLIFTLILSPVSTLRLNPTLTL